MDLMAFHFDRPSQTPCIAQNPPCECDLMMSLGQVAQWPQGKASSAQLVGAKTLYCILQHRRAFQLIIVRRAAPVLEYAMFTIGFAMKR